MLLGSGIFIWDGVERRLRRYGFVTLNNANYFGDVQVPTNFDTKVAGYYEGKRVKLTAIVTEARKSGHVGDMFLKIFPSTPEVGETIVLGVGTLTSDDASWATTGRSFGLKPSDNRETLWLDPRLLYRLHDQTVELHVEETNEPDHEAPDLEGPTEGTIALGNGEYQIQGNHPLKGTKIKPKITRLGDGLFMMGPHEKGDEVELIPPQE